MQIADRTILTVISKYVYIVITLNHLMNLEPVDVGSNISSFVIVQCGLQVPDLKLGIRPFTTF